MPSVAIVASGLFNLVLLATLLAWQQMDTAPLAARTVSTATWCQPRPAALQPPQLQPQPVFSVPQPSGSDGVTAATASIADVARLENDKLKQKLTNVVAELSKMRASHSAQAVQLREARQSSSSSSESFYSSSEARLKRIWMHPPHWSYKEAHNDSWTFLSSRQLSRGVISQGDPLRLSCLAEKLAAGHTIHLSVIGGSVSFGTTFTTSKSRSLFHWKVYQYLNASFPQGAHEHFMGAVPASGPSYMEHCLDWHLPPAGADLVLVEYAVNFDSTEEDSKSFERLIRRLLRLPNQPAVIIINTMELVPPHGGLPWEDDKTPYPSATDLSFNYRTTGAEDAINDIAQYYGVPCVSLRGALFDQLKANSSAFPIKQIYHDRHHPSAWGHSLMAQMATRLLDDALGRVFDRAAAGEPTSTSRPAGSQAPPPTAARKAKPSPAVPVGQLPSCAVTLREAPVGSASEPGPRLWSPIFSTDDGPPIGTCVKDKALAARLAPGTAGFQYIIEGTDAKMKPGIVGKAPGDVARFCLDVSKLERGSPFVFIVGHLISYEHMGVVAVTCADDCECGTTEIDAHVPGGKFSVFKGKTFTARRLAAPPATLDASTPADCGCKVQLTILEKTGSKEHKFKVLSLMTAKHEGSLRYGHQAGFNNRPTEARFT